MSNLIKVGDRVIHMDKVVQVYWDWDASQTVKRLAVQIVGQNAEGRARTLWFDDGVEAQAIWRYECDRAVDLLAPRDMNNVDYGGGVVAALDHYEPIAGSETPQDVLQEWFNGIGPAFTADEFFAQLQVSLTGDGWRKLMDAMQVPESARAEIMEKIGG